MVDDIPDVSDEKPVGSNASTSSGASSSRVLPSDVLMAWDGCGSWKLKTARLIPFYGIMSVEGVVAPDYEDQAIMILAARLSPAILQEGREFGVR